jgi:hypothetical protein
MEHPYEGFVNNLSCRREPRQYKHKIGWKIIFIQHLGPFSVIQTPIFGAALVGVCYSIYTKEIILIADLVKLIQLVLSPSLVKSDNFSCACCHAGFFFWRQKYVSKQVRVVPSINRPTRVNPSVFWRLKKEPCCHVVDEGSHMNCLSLYTSQS